MLFRSRDLRKEEEKDAHVRTKQARGRSRRAKRRRRIMQLEKRMHTTKKKDN